MVKERSDDPPSKTQTSFAAKVAHFNLFGHLLGKKLEVNTSKFWFMMQLAMLCELATANPVNWWLIRKGLKEKM